nr:MAG TPA: hypothetical protein [Caudoviricetes sp.]
MLLIGDRFHIPQHIGGFIWKRTFAVLSAGQRK